MSYEVGDVIMLPVPASIPVNELPDYIATVTGVDGTDAIGITSHGKTVRVPMSSATLVATARATITSMIQKGVELCRRAT